MKTTAILLIFITLLIHLTSCIHDTSTESSVKESIFDGESLFETVTPIRVDWENLAEYLNMPLSEVEKKHGKCHTLIDGYSAYVTTDEYLLVFADYYTGRTWRVCLIRKYDLSAVEMLEELWLWSEIADSSALYEHSDFNPGSFCDTGTIDVVSAYEHLDPISHERMVVVHLEWWWVCPPPVVVTYSMKREVIKAENVTPITVDWENLAEYLNMPLSEVEKKHGDYHTDVGNGVWYPAYITTDGYLLVFDMSCPDDEPHRYHIYGIRKYDLFTDELVQEISCESEE